MQDDLVLAVASLPIDCVQTGRELPKHWLAAKMHFGDRWLASHQALKVPSAIYDPWFNVVLSPQHRDCERQHGSALTPRTLDPLVCESPGGPCDLRGLAARLTALSGHRPHRRSNRLPIPDRMPLSQWLGGG